MKIVILGSITLLGFSKAFAPLYCATKVTGNARVPAAKNPIPSRRKFVAGGIIGIIVGQVKPAHSRGRATLEQSYDRYSPRLLDGGKFYSKDLRKAIDKSDWASIKAATQEPPGKSSKDRTKADGGVSERAALAGGFSNARVLTAADLWASSFSDNSLTTKTKQMKAQVEELREVVNGMSSIAKIALGEEKSGGAFMGLGTKSKSKAELAKEVRELYVKGGNAWNQFAFLSNEGLPVQLKKLPYL